MATVAEQIAKRKALIKTAQGKIIKEEGKIEKLQKEIETLENLQVRAMLKELDMPIEQVREALRSLKETPVPLAYPEQGGREGAS